MSVQKIVQKISVQKGAMMTGEVSAFKAVLKPKMDMGRKVTMRMGKGITPDKGNAWKVGMMGR